MPSYDMCCCGLFEVCVESGRLVNMQLREHYAFPRVKGARTASFTRPD